MNKFFFKAAAVLLVLIACASADAKNIALNTSNTVLFKGEVSEESVESSMQKLKELNTKRGSKNYPIYLVLDTPGGSIGAGMDFIEYAKSIKNLHTVTFSAASMGSAIVQALPGKRYIIETGVLMFHRAQGGFRGQFETGEVESRLEMAKDMVRHLELTNANRMKLSLFNYKRLVVNEYWLYGVMAKNRNAADDIVSVTCSDKLIEERAGTKVMTIFGPVEVAFSGCPLFKGYSVSSAEDQKKLDTHKNLMEKLQNVETKN